METKALKTRNRNIIKVIFASCLFIFSYQTQAQKVLVNVNVNSTPKKVVRYVESPSYYYYPEIETYFDTNSSVYIYFSKNNWVRSRYLPTYYRDYDVRHGQRVMLDYRGPEPYIYCHEHKNKYKHKSYKKGKKYKNKKYKKREH